MDCLPDNCVEDMMQIVKHNSIEGSKMASAKIVWTPHSNLKKNFDMEVGQVTYHDTKLCRYGRCHKDRTRIKALEKTKSIDHTDIDLYAEKKKNERALIERRKRHKKFLARTTVDKGEEAGSNGLFDPIESDRKQTLLKQTRQGDEQSGIDKGVAALESLALGDPFHGVASPGGSANGDGTSSSRSGGNIMTIDNDVDDTPIWKREYRENERDYGDNEMALFLLERGYPRSSVDTVLRQSKPKTNVGALQTAWTTLGNDNASAIVASQNDIDGDEMLAARQEEKEVLEAIFGEDIEWTNSANDCSILDSSVPITNYNPPERYFVGSDPPPELRLEIYVSPTNYPFGGQAPILALIGGGIPQEYLNQLTRKLYDQATSKALEEEPGTPFLFELITLVGGVWESFVEEEGAAVTKAAEEARKARIQAVRQQQQERAELEAQSGHATSSFIAASGSTKFKTEQERRAYAAGIVAQCKTGRPAHEASNTANASSGKGKQYYDTGVSDAQLVEDLFS